MDFKDDIRFIIITLAICVLAPFTLISSFVFTAKFYSVIFNVPCQVCGDVKK